MEGNLVMQFFITIVLPTLGVLFLLQLVRVYRRFKYFQSLPGPDEYSLIHGNLHKLPAGPSDTLEFGEQMMNKFKTKFHRVWIGPITPFIFTYHPETIKKVLHSSAPKSRGFGSPYELLRSWVGQGIGFANGERWARSRRLITPAFHFDILKNYVQVYNQAADSLFKKFDKFAETRESFDVCPMVKLCTLEAILKCSLGYEADIQGEGHPYAVAVAEILDAFFKRFRRPWLWPECIFRRTAEGKKYFEHCSYVHKFSEDIIEKRKRSLEKDGIPQNRRLDFIDILLTAKDEDGKTMTNEEIRNEVDTLMFAGQDTTATAIPWCLYMFAKHPEYQERVQEEVDAILDGRDCDEIKWTDLSKLETLTICVKETMRLYSPVPFIQRQLDRDMELDGHVIPAGTRISISLYLLQRNPLVWDDPEEYRPERHLIENKRNTDLFAFLPFSAGPRNCIGQVFAMNEGKVLLSRILRRYTVGLASDKEPPIKSATVVLKANNGMWLNFQRRKISNNASRK